MLKRDLPTFYYKKPTYTILVNTDENSLTLLNDDEYYKSYPIAVGKNSTPTPKGIFNIIRKVKNPGGPFGSRWMELSIRHYGIHGTNDPSSIGKDVSHGCIRMLNENVNELYDLVPLGTEVEII